MFKLQRLDVTPEMAARLRAVEDALALHMPGRDSSADIELPKLLLADLVMEQARRQQLLPEKARPAKATIAAKRSRKRA